MRGFLISASVAIFVVAGGAVAQTVPKAKAPAAKAAPKSAAAGGVATGDYECWAYGRPRLLLNFTVTGPGAYRASDDSTGRFTFNPATKAITFTGYLSEVMPKGFTTIYHQPGGHPTVSFRGASGEEASFCEKAG